MNDITRTPGSESSERNPFEGIVSPSELLKSDAAEVAQPAPTEAHQNAWSPETAEIKIQPTPEINLPEPAPETVQMPNSEEDLANQIVGEEPAEPEKAPFVQSSQINEIQELPVELTTEEKLPETDENEAKVEAVEAEVRSITERAKEASLEIDEAIKAIEANNLIESEEFKELERKFHETITANHERIKSLESSKNRIKTLLGEGKSA